MKKLKTVLSLVIITVLTTICLTLLYVLYNDDGEFNFFQSTTEVTESGAGFQELDSGEDFHAYMIDRKDMSKVELNINGAYVRFENEALWIQENLMMQGSQINRNFAVYNDSVLVFPFLYKAKVYGGLVIYNIYTNEYSVIDKIDKMYLDITNEDQIITFMNNGVSLDLKNVDNNLVMDGDDTKNICKYKGKIRTARKSIIYIYDKNDKKFDDIETISELSLESYIVSNGLC